MHYFMCRLIPPRKTISRDMSDLERELMRQHAAYWTELLNRKQVLLFGPVDDPNGTFGLCVLSLSDEPAPAAAAARLCQNDPIQLGNIGFTFEVLAMPRIVHYFLT